MRGQLPHGTASAVAADRILSIGETGEACRQTVRRNHDKLKVYEDIIEQLNAKAGAGKGR